MPVDDYLEKQEESRRPLLRALHQTILEKDPTVIATIGLMMGKEMIIYNHRGSFKYGLASVKDYMSLHVLPIYGSPPLHGKYAALLPDAKLQKGCINFRNEEEMPLAVAEQLFTDCSPIDLIAIRQAYLDSKKKPKAAKT
jgi:hypothetical protein